MVHIFRGHRLGLDADRDVLVRLKSAVSVAQQNGDSAVAEVRGHHVQVTIVIKIGKRNRPGTGAR